MPSRPSRTFFWTFCDDYVELVKDRAYGARGDGPAASARKTLSLALSTQLRLFAPFLPFVTEEVWSWWQEGSVHRATWPTAEELAGGPDVPGGTLAAVGDVLSLVRKAKSEAKVSMRADVSRVVVSATPEVLARVQGGVEDLRAAGRIAELELVASDGPGDAVAVDVELAPEPTA